jgi:glucan 1,3-beta-glucosidase
MSQNALKGVNLGGWLVLEKWITPSLFNGLKAEDEYSYCKEQGKKAAKKLKKFRESYITGADFKWLSDHGFNAVRIPIG